MPDDRKTNSGSARLAGQTVRGAVAWVSLIVNGGFAVIALLWSCCGGVNVISSAANPIFWGAFSSATVAVMSFPPVSEGLRRRSQRWLCWPFVIGSALFLSQWGVLVEEVGTWYRVVLVSTAICMTYVVVRVIAAPPHEDALQDEEDTNGEV